MPGGTGGFPGRILQDGGVTSAKLSTRLRKYTYDPFDCRPKFSKSDGYSDPTGATGDLNMFNTPYGAYEWHVKGAGQTIVAPVWDATTGLGLNFAQDLTSTEGHETLFGSLMAAGDARGKHAFTIGTDAPFFAQFKFRAADTSGVGYAAFGFRVTEAYATALATYAELACIDTNTSSTSAKIQIKTNLAAAGAATVDTTQTMLDNTSRTYRLEVDGTGKVRFFVDGLFPTVTKTNFTFTAGGVVQPFFFFLHAATSPGALYYQMFECGYLNPRGV